MENCSLHSQILSVMEVLAKAAVAEIHRRVDDSCAVLRLEVSQSRRDIELLRRKCEMMEAELRRTRMRARRKGFYPPAAERFTPSVKIVLNKVRRSTDWDALQMDADTQNPPQQIDQAELVKEEHSEEHMWRNNLDETPTSEVSQPAQSDSFTEHQQSDQNPVLPGSAVSPADGYDTFPEQQVDGSQNEAEFIVKLEKDEEPDENAAPHDLAQTFKAGEGDGQLWSSSLCNADPNSSYTGQQFEISPSMFPSHSGLVPDTASTTQAIRCARTFGYKRPQLDEGQTTLSQVNSISHCLLPQQPQHQHRGSAPHPNDDSTQSNTAVASSCGRSSFSLVRRMRTPWRSGVGEKRFSCTYCEKSFMRFSQLKEHLRSHTGEKPFSCLQCGRSFTKQCNLIRHAVVHSGEKPYKCSQCGKCFTQRSSLKSHQKTAH